MLEKVKLGGIGFMVGLLVAAFTAKNCYDIGFDHGTAEAEARQASAVEIAQNEVKKDYEKRVQELTVSIERLRIDNAERLRKIKRFNQTSGNLETCRRDRSDLARLAVRGEELLKRADSYLEALSIK